MHCGGMLVSGRHRGWFIRARSATNRGGDVGTIAQGRAQALQSALAAVTRTCAVRSAAFRWGRTSSFATATSKEGGKIVTYTIIFIITTTTLRQR